MIRPTCDCGMGLWYRRCVCCDAPGMEEQPLKPPHSPVLMAVIWAAAGLVTGIMIGYFYAIEAMLSYTPAVYP